MTFKNTLEFAQQLDAQDELKNYREEFIFPQHNGENVIYFAVACFTAYYFSGHSGIYHSQKIAVSKLHINDDKDKK